MPTQFDRQLPASLAIVMTIGNDYARTLTVTDSNSDPIDLSSKVWELVIHPKDNGDEVEFEHSNAGNSGELTAGIFKFKISKSISTQIGVGDHRFCISWDNAGETDKRTFLSGPLTVKAC